MKRKTLDVKLRMEKKNHSSHGWQKCSVSQPSSIARAFTLNRPFGGLRQPFFVYAQSLLKVVDISTSPCLFISMPYVCLFMVRM